MENITIRDICGNDKEEYIKLQKEMWIKPENIDGDQEKLWEMKLEDEQINCTITDGNTIYGFCGVKRKVDVYPEVEIEIFKEYAHKGIGSYALTLLLERGAKEKGFRTFIAKVSPDNYPSILLFRKLGAKTAGLKRNIVIDEKETEEYETRNKDYITDNLRSVAKLFQVEAECLLSHNLIFQMDMPIPKVPQFDLELKGNLQYEKNIERCAYRYHKEYLVRELTKIKDQIANAKKKEDIEESFTSLIAKMELLL